jgi:hypothetical protein
VAKDTYDTRDEATIRLEKPIQVRDSVRWYVVPHVSIGDAGGESAVLDVIYSRP